MFRPISQTQKVVDLVIAIAFVLVFALFFVRAYTVTSSPVILLVVVALGGALALRRWSPPLALTAAWIGAIAQMIAGDTPNLYDAAIPPIVYACAVYGTRAARWAAFSSSLVGAGIAGVYTARYTFFGAVRGDLGDVQETLRVFGIVGALTAVTLLLAWTLGVLVRTAQRSRRNRQEADAAGEQVAAEQERTRIARDMHDVVAHSLAVVIAQSDGARLLRRTDPEAVDEALETIGSTARAALADVRVLLQQLRYEGTTSVQPGLADLDTLFAQFQGSGLEVDVVRDPDLGGLGTAVQLAAFRIVQESLTNALRHGDLTRPASVVLTRTPHGLEVEVVNAVDPSRPPRTSPGGHGLIGMRERAGAVQGDLRAGPDGDRFRVRAFLPVGATAGPTAAGSDASRSDGSAEPPGTVPIQTAGAR
ncbi:sensor histidine kinase [Amnibacterium kyonggiense]|uniref:sensor histidine kinase n=1 Tax=Amnibacterium kyonggiense TaxID=595671 RepID=UPI00105CE0DB|nr:histidine kinase [Amnibacterium kyonggiense]